MQNKKNNRGATYFFIFAIIGMLLYVLLSPNLNKSETALRYDEVMQYFDLNKIEQNQVEEWTLNLGTGKLQFKLRNDDKTYTLTYDDPQDLRDRLIEYTEAYNMDAPAASKIKYNIPPTTASFWDILVTFLPTLLMVGIGVLLIVSMMRQSNQIGGVGRAKAKQISESDRTAVFDDVAGADEEKEELLEIVEYLKDPKRFTQLGAKIPKGVLLVGPPGTGKTLLARAVAGEAGVPFYSISGSDFVELYVGVGASRVRDLFERAKKNRPSIIFIDEIDAVGRQRGAGLGGGHDEREQTLNQLLVELDGFIGNEGVIVMAATNRADVLDHALLRPGRFDRQIFVGYPDIKGREEILKVHARNKPLGPDVDLKTIAKTTPGFTGADLENLLNEGALLAARRRKKAITQEEIEEASIKVMMGPEKKSRVVTEKKRRIAAYHEAGHALAHYYVTPDKPVHQVSIVPRGTAGGYTMYRPDEDDDNTLISKQDMTNEIITLLGGRVAERLILNDITTGASNDLERATTLARAMVTKYGFSETVGPVVYTQNEVFLGRDYTQSHTYSERIAGDIDDEVRGIIENAMRTCIEVLTDHMDKLHDVANALLEHDKLDDEEFLAVMEGPAAIEAPKDNPKDSEDPKEPEKKSPKKK